MHPRYELRKGRFMLYLFQSLLISNLCHYFILRQLCGFSWPATVAMHFGYHGAGMTFLLSQFIVSHTFTGINHDNYNWVETAAKHTVNVKDHWLVNIVMGLLNFQIEHHLFPQMAHINARRAAPYVKELFRKHNLPYFEYGYFEGFGLAFKNLYHVGFDLTPVRPVSIDLAKPKTL